MQKKESLIEMIISFIWGHKYYANIIRTNGVKKYEISSFIFARKEDAEKHHRDIQETRTFTYVETISFRSRMEY